VSDDGGLKTAELPKQGGPPPVTHECEFRSPTYAREFFVGRDVHDFELFGVHRGIFAELEFAEVAFLDFDEVLFVLGAETLENGWVNDDEELEIGFVARTFLENFAELALNLDAHGEGALHFAAAFAVRAIVVDG
jgi:hypothetical protein